MVLDAAVVPGAAYGAVGDPGAAAYDVEVHVEDLVEGLVVDGAGLAQASSCADRSDRGHLDRLRRNLVNQNRSLLYY